MPNRKRYIVQNKGVTEGFTKAGIESLKALDMVVFKGTTRYPEGTVYRYVRKGDR
jgi:hypothetical protein